MHVSFITKPDNMLFLEVDIPFQPTVGTRIKLENQIYTVSESTLHLSMSKFVAPYVICYLASNKLW